MTFSGGSIPEIPAADVFEAFILNNYSPDKSYDDDHHHHLINHHDDCDNNDDDSY